MIPLADLVSLHAPVRGELIAAFAEVLDSGQFILGSRVADFETALSAYCGASRAIGTSSGTDALLATLMALEVRPGDEIITTPFTFFATVGAILRLSATPVFADIDPQTGQIDPVQIAAVITPRTVGIIPVHLFGAPADMSAIKELAARHHLWVVEDAAQGLGARHRGRMAGTFGTAGIYSFFPAKNLGALGDAGAVVTNDAALADKLNRLRTHGAAKKYHHDILGGNFRMDALQAALLSVKLPHLERWNEKRRQVAGRYTAAFRGNAAIECPAQIEGDLSTFNPYVIKVRNRDAVQRRLERSGVSSACMYPQPVHLSPVVAHLGHRVGDFPVSERAAAQSLAIPADPHLNNADQEKITTAVIRASGSTDEERE